LFAHVITAYRRKTSHTAETAYPVIRDVYQQSGQQFENIAVPLTDGIKTMQVVANLKKAYDSEGRELVRTFERSITLAMIDEDWKEHLREMDDLKQSVQNAVYEQKDPLLIYKFESFELFQKMLDRVNKEIVSFLLKASLPNGTAPQNQVREAKQQQAPQPKLKTSREDDLGNANQNVQNQDTREVVKTAPVRVEQKVGRNDPCPCGSGKKFKACHGKDLVN
jgi:preprotein translocase subunit SecA